MQNLMNDLTKLFQKDDRIFADGKLLKNKLTELALKLDQPIIELLLSDDKAKKHFFIEKTVRKDKVLVFDKDKFIAFVNNKEFLTDSFTSFKNKIGLMTNGDYLKEKGDVVLAWAYKDCVLEGGQDKEDQKRDEIFYNEMLAPDQIDRLLEAKVFANFKLVDSKGEHKIERFTDKDNLIIKGNNLLALHSLKRRFRGKIKLIYIDPPYNTGNDDFHYNDKFNHSTWLTFMKNRLEVARGLLREDGVIFVQIDYIEQAYLKVLMDEIFGKDNFIQIISVKTATPAGFKVVNPGPVNVTEFILMYTKNRQLYNHKKGYVKVDYQRDYNNYIENYNEKPESWKIIDIRKAAIKHFGYKDLNEFQNKYDKETGDIVLWNLVAKFAKENSEKVFATYAPHKPSETLREAVEESKSNPKKITHLKREGSGDSFLLNGRLLAFYNKKLQVIDGELCPTQLLTDFWSDLSWDSLSAEGGVRLKNGKKPEALIKRIIELTTESGELVLDYHLGSGTSCAVAHKMGRQYIGIEQLDYGENSALNRLNNVIKGDQTGVSKAIGWKGGGSFIYIELKEWNGAYTGEIKKAEMVKELLKIYEKMKKEAFFRYEIDLSKFDEKDFGKLALKDQKQILMECLDKNHLYVNLSELDDATYKVSTEDKKLNKEFYNTVT